MLDYGPWRGTLYAQKVRHRRRTLNMPILALAIKLGYTPGQTNRAVKSVASIQELIRIAEALDVSVSYLVDDMRPVATRHLTASKEREFLIQFQESEARAALKFEASLVPWYRWPLRSLFKAPLVRIGRTIHQMGIDTTEDLCKLSESDLLKLSGFGPTSAAVLRQRLAKRGLSLADDPPQS